MSIPHTLQSLLTLAETEEGRQQIRVLVAEHLYPQFPVFKKGTELRHDYGNHNSGPMQPYDTSLDAIMPEVRKLDEDQQNTWLNHMSDIFDPMGELGWKVEFLIATAEPIRHCISLLLTIQPATP